MNERIQELSKQANLQDGWFCGQGNIEKFARLIVGECANVAAEHEALDIYEEIREHFGVEE